MTRILRVADADEAPQHLVGLREWFAEEWGDLELFPDAADGVVPPGPLLAVDDTELLGGLAFSVYAKPDGGETGLWINALFVVPERRRRGIASELIRAAEGAGRAAGCKELFALTDLPQLYRRCGWSVVRSGEDGFVLKRVVG